MAILAPGMYVKLDPDMVRRPPDSAALKPWNDSPVGVYKVLSKVALSGAGGTSVQEITFDPSMLIFVAPV